MSDYRERCQYRTRRFRFLVMASVPPPDAMFVIGRARGAQAPPSPWSGSGLGCAGHERRFRDVRDNSRLPPTPERLRQRSEPTKCQELPPHARPKNIDLDEP